LREERELLVVLRRAVLLARSRENRLGIAALVHVQRDGRHLEARVLGLPRPDELRVRVRVVGVLLLTGVGVRRRNHEPYRRVVGSLLVLVLVRLDRLLRARPIQWPESMTIRIDLGAPYSSVVSVDLLREVERIQSLTFRSASTTPTVLALAEPTADGLLSLIGVGKELWAGEDAQDYVSRLRSEWR